MKFVVPIFRKFSIVLLYIILSIVEAHAQIPNTGFYFQAIARDNFSNPAKDRIIYVQTAIIQKTIKDVVVLHEEFQTTTDASGVFGISIGLGRRIGGSKLGLNDIEWENGPYHLNLKIAITPLPPLNNWDYTKEWIDLGTVPFGNVPYAMYAGKTANMNDKLNVSDTSKMLSQYAKNASLVELSNIIENHLALSDTSDMLLPYQNAIRTLELNYNTTINNKLINDLSNKINITDSNSVYITPYQFSNKTFDTSFFSNQLKNKINYADTASMLSGYLRVGTSVPFSGIISYEDLIDLPDLDLKENLKNKSIDISLDSNSNVKYPSTKAVKAYVEKFSRNLINNSLVDANDSSKGIIQLAGDLTGSASFPIIANNAITDSKIANGISQNKVGLGNVDNTSDLDKPISKATQAALDLKMNLSIENSLISSVNSKLNISDTASMISTRFNRDTTYLSNRINLKVNSSDSNMIYATPFYVNSKIIDTTNLSNRINSKYDAVDGITNASNISLKLNKSDTIYLNNRINNKINTADSLNAYVTPYSLQVNKFDSTSLSNRINLKINTSDTSIMLSNRFTRDTAALSNRINLKLSLIDTSSMLSKRIGRDTVTISNRINAKLNTIDTSSMLAAYLNNSFTKESLSNKSTDTTLGGLLASNMLYPTQYAVKKYIENNAASINILTGTSSSTAGDASNYTKGIIQLAGDLSGTASYPIVVSISGIPKDSIANAINFINNSSSNNIVNTVVIRNSIGDFAGATISANTFKGELIGNVTGNLIGNVTGTLTGNVTGDATNVSGVVSIANGGTGGINSSQARTNLGLGNIDNTSDAAKPVSTLQQSAINLKANLASPIFTGTPILPSGTTGTTQALNDNSTKIATTEYVANALADANGTITNAVADATTTSKGKILLAGDLSGTATLPIVASVGGKTKDEILGAINTINTATNSNTANSIVKRDANGAFYGNIIGNATNVTGIVSITNGGTGATSVNSFKTNFALDNIDNTSDINKPISTAVTNALALKINNSSIGVANGIASLGSDGKVPSSQLPSFSITTVNVVNNQANMLALTGLSVGAVAIRTDNSTNYILTTLPASTLSNWQTFYPAGVNVQSVNGLTGAVALTGTSNRLNISASNVFDIASTYIGQSSITTLGTITTGTWNGSAIPIANGGTGASTASNAFNALAPSQSGNNGKFLTTNGTNTSWASVDAAGGWSTSGNSGLTDGSYYLGTTDAQPLNFKAGGIQSGRIDISSIIGQTSLGYGAAYNALRSTTASTYYGTKNTSIGFQANFNSYYGKENTALGYQALTSTYRTSGSTAIGFQAMSNFNDNSAVAADIISYNSALGYQAMQGSTTPASNTGTYNTAIGYQALKAMTSGSYNSALGTYTLANNTSGGYNSAIGYQALYANTTGNYNIAIGRLAAYNITTGTGNTALGNNAMISNITGNNNTAIGYSTNITEGVNNASAFGYGAANSTSNTIQLGNSSITKVSTAGALFTGNTTASSSITTGALIVSGGEGIAGNSYIGGNSVVTGSITTSNDLNAKHIKGNSSTPTIAASIGAGTTPTGVTVTGTDMSGFVTLTTGTSPSINAILATINYSTAYSTSPIVVITPANAATASLASAQAVWVNIGTSNFSINTNATALNASTTYKWNYVVIQ